MSDLENSVADIVSVRKMLRRKDPLPYEVVVQSNKFPSTTSEHRHGSLELKACCNWQYDGALPGSSFHHEASETPHLQ